MNSVSIILEESKCLYYICLERINSIFEDQIKLKIDKTLINVFDGGYLICLFKAGLMNYKLYRIK